MLFPLVVSQKAIRLLLFFYLLTAQGTKPIVTLFPYSSDNFFPKERPQSNPVLEGS